MALRKVIHEGDPLLRKRSREIKEITDHIRTLADDMWETMYESNGVGLAAPQVGVLRRLIVVDVTMPLEEEDEEEETGEEGSDWEAGQGQAHGIPGAEENPDVQDISEEIPGTNETQEVPDAQDTPEAPETQDTPETQQDSEPETVKFLMINPEIIEISEETTTAKEGCLSLPGLVGTVTRPSRVKVCALDLEGNVFEVEGEGILAKALLHEIDHLEGILYTDIAESVEEINPESDEEGDPE